MSSTANLMEYNGFFGSISESVEDKCLYGKLEYIRPLVNYQGNSPTELKQAFEKAVDDYLADCKAKGIAPETPVKGSI